MRKLVDSVIKFPFQYVQEQNAEELLAESTGQFVVKI
jgi:hypothetical protein